MKKLGVVFLASGLTLICPHLHALIPGPYLGGQLGYSRLDYSLANLNATSGTINSDGVGGRIYGGYQFNKYWSTELGYEKFSSANFNNLMPNNRSGNSEVSAIDLIEKGNYPLGECGLSIFAKAGGAYTMNNVSNVITNNGGPRTVDKLLFTYGLGFNYQFSPKVISDLTWMRIQNNQTVPNADLITLGLSYNFG